ncbi:MAG: hypothetical protein KDJ45_04065 [Hyphomicrobiaceae bacterium]|nr:hypothetical protein [Hyphomicrobiaceae bacterium]MCC0011314.1 hypothetical protein [Hyphomicrobiaceae bacterium]
MTLSLKNLTKSPLIVAAAIAIIGLVGQSGSAAAVSLAVKRACMGDYFSHCSNHAVGSPGVRRCMRNAGPRLSKRCINALIDAGEVSRSEVSRRAAQR